MTERRYKESEVRKILELATRQPTGQGSPAAAGGLTLAEIQSIGVEVGVEPDAVARAAASLESGSIRSPRRSLGMPIEVAHTVHLPRALTVEEWEQLVAELRSTFRARGKVTAHGHTREWWNGNLHICHEPTASGFRLRMDTVKGDASGWNAVGLTGLATAGIMVGSFLLSGEAQAAIFVPAVFGVSGVGALVGNALRLPRWREQRRQQMQHIASRVAAMVRSTTGAGEEPLALPGAERAAPGE